MQDWDTMKFGNVVIKKPDLEESHKKEVGQLLIEIAELKKEKEYVIEHTADVINGQECEIRHQKYKRCLAMANWCKSRQIYLHSLARIYSDKELWEYASDYWIKWSRRWLELAKKFKES